MCAQHSVMACIYGFAGSLMSFCVVGQALRENYLLAVILAVPASVAWARCRADWKVAERFSTPEENQTNE